MKNIPHSITAVPTRSVEIIMQTVRESARPRQYDEDFYAWTQEQAGRLRAGALAGLDLEHLAEEIESMGVSQRNELKNRLRVLLLHLLKWRFQPTERSSGWVGIIIEQRDRLELLLQESPSLQGMLSEAMVYAYPKARRAASRETQLPLSAFPEACPFTLEQTLNEDFWPD